MHTTNMTTEAQATYSEKELWEAFRVALIPYAPHGKRKKTEVYLPGGLMVEERLAGLAEVFRILGTSSECNVYTLLSNIETELFRLAHDVDTLSKDFLAFMKQHSVSGDMDEDDARYRVPVVAPESRASVAA